MEVIILAGGLGTRLRSVVSEVPKCMAPVAGKPFLWYILMYLAHFDVSRVVLSVGYLREVILEWINEVKETFPFEFDFAIEDKPLGTGGGIRLAMQHIHGQKAVILNGDTFFDVDLNSLLLSHNSNPWAKITLALKPMRDFDRYGTVDLGQNGHILCFNEKQPCKKGVINGGVYILTKDQGLYFGLPDRFSFETQVLQKHCGPSGCLQGIVYDDYFIDIGIPQDYNRIKDCFIIP